jgi:hypothetical protein
MVRLGISVEEQTEERFVKDVLAPHLMTFEVHAIPVIVATSRAASGKKAKGGGINVDRVRNEISRLLKGFHDGYVTCLYDYYGFEGRKKVNALRSWKEGFPLLLTHQATS